MNIFSLALLFIWIAVIIWVYRDAERRGMNGVLWALLVLIGNLIALIIYLIVRSDNIASPRRETPPSPPSASPPPAVGPPKTAGAASPAGKTTDCPKCGRAVPADFSFCPHCGSPMSPRCPACGKEVEEDWKACPHCGKKLADQ